MILILSCCRHLSVVQPVCNSSEVALGSLTVQAPGADTAAAILAERFASPESCGIEVPVLPCNPPSLTWRQSQVPVGAETCNQMAQCFPDQDNPHTEPRVWLSHKGMRACVQELSLACDRPGFNLPNHGGGRSEELASLLVSIPDRAAASSLKALRPAAFARQVSLPDICALSLQGF